MSLRFKLLNSLENVVEENVGVQTERLFKWECVLVQFLDLDSEKNVLVGMSCWHSISC